MKQQIVVALRYVDKKGRVIERFLGIEHLADISSLSLKVAVEGSLCGHGLSLSRLRGQGHDGIGDMRDAFNCLKTLILEKIECAYCVHSFIHELEATLLNVARNYSQISLFFNLVARVVNVVSAPCKYRDTLQEKQKTEVIEALNNGDFPSGQGLNGEINLKRHSDTSCGAYYGAFSSLISMFSSEIDVFEMIIDDGLDSYEIEEAYGLSGLKYSFELVFTLHFMKSILESINELSRALMRKDQDIVIAIILVQVSKKRLQMMKETGCCSLLDDVSSFLWETRYCCS